MSRSQSIIVIPIAIGIASVLALTGCSAGSGAAPTSASSPATESALGTDSSAVGPLAAAPVAPLAAAAVTPLVASSDTTGSDRNLITAQGVGRVNGTPDVVTIALGVETRSSSAQSALDDNNKLAADTIAVLKDSGVAPEDVQTSQLSVNPTYDDKGTVTGYQVTNMVTAKLRDIGKAGAVIDAAGKAAGDAIRVQQLSFAIDDDSAPRAAARADAVKRAQAQAKQLADAAGVALGSIHSITETAAPNPTVYPAMAAADAAGASVPIEAGSVQLSVTVQVVYEIAQ